MVMETLEAFKAAGPPVNVAGALRTLGVSVNQAAELPEGISGHLRKKDDGSYEAAASAAEHPYRQRFTLAHELGHFVLHRSLVDLYNGVDDTTMYRSTALCEIYNTAIKQSHERQANSFAAHFLMPENHLREAVAGNPPIIDLVHQFQVSPSAMRWRLKNLGLMAKVQE